MLIIHDEDVRGNRIHTLRVANNDESLSVGDILKRRIENEITRFNLQRPVCFFSLVQPKNSEITPRGFRLREHRAIDWETQFQAAIEAFDKKGFIVNINGKDVQGLDDIIDTSDVVEVVMIRCMEIVAG